MDSHLTLKEQHNRCMKKPRAAEVRLRTLSMRYGIVPQTVRAVHLACVQAFALYWRELWWDPRELGRRDDLQLLLNQHARSILGALLTTPQGAQMRESRFTPAPVMVDSRQEPFTVRLVNACSSMLKELQHNPSYGALICREIREEHGHRQATDGMDWPRPAEQSFVRTTIQDDTTAAKYAVQCWTREKIAKIGAGVWMWWTDGLSSDDGQVGAGAVCKHGNQWRSRRSCLCTGRMDVFEAEIWVIRLALDMVTERRETLQKHGVKMVAVFSESQAAIRSTAHLEPVTAQQLARRIDRRAGNVLPYTIPTEIHWVPGNSTIPRNEEANHQVSLARDATGSRVIDRAYTSASNRGR